MGAPGSQGGSAPGVSPGGAGTDPLAQLYLPTLLTESDPNAIASAAALDALSDRITMANAGVARLTPDVAASWRGQIRDMTGALVTGMFKADLYRFAVRFAAALPTDVGVFVIAYDGSAGADAPSATDFGFGCIVTGAHVVQMLLANGGAWVRGAASGPAVATGRIGMIGCSEGAAAAQKLMAAGLYDAAGVELEGTATSAVNAPMTNINTIAVGVTWEGVGGANGATIDLAGIAAVLALATNPLTV